MKEMRPTTGKVMQAVFNILGPLDGKAFLDLFAGSGQMAREAGRRGAATVCAVESDKKRHADIVKSIPKDIKCFCMDVRRAVPKFAKNGESFDVIFADPPYELGWGYEFIKLVASNENVLADGGVIIFEHSCREKVGALDAERWETESRVYGGTELTFYRRKRADR